LSCPLCANRYSIASSGREQQRWNFEAECFARPQLNQGLAWLVAATVALCSVHSPGPGLARMVAAMAGRVFAELKRRVKEPRE
jgi:hypothetical protein